MNEPEPQQPPAFGAEVRHAADLLAALHYFAPVRR